jgi:signal transduction histidine kinase
MPVAVAGALLATCGALALLGPKDPIWVLAGAGAGLTGIAWLLIPRRPLWAVAPIMVALVLGEWSVEDRLDSVPAMVLTLLVVTYRIGEASPLRQSASALAVITLTGQAITIASGGWYPGDILFAFTVYSLPMVFGRIVATGRVAQAELEQRTAELEAERRRRAALEVARERERLAAQVNGVVTGALRTMVEDAGRGLHALPTDRAGAGERLLEIETTGRDALREMRALLGVLREEQPEAA